MDNTTGNFVELELEKLIEAPHNYRRTHDPAAAAELEASIREKGILSPLLVRPKGRQFEIVFGHRRFRAAKAAGLSSAPAQVRELTDVQALEAAVVENAQRSDVHPIEEADGFARLHNDHGYTVAQIATKTGRSESWVRARLKLAELDASGKKACFDGKLSPGVVMLVARLVPPARQKAAIADLASHGTKDDPVTIEDARRRLLRGYATDLETAPWKLDDAGLCPEAGACASCPKRTANDASLFADLARADVCTDGKCFQAKLDAHWARVRSEAESKGKRVLSEEESKKLLGRGFLASEAFVDATDRNYFGHKQEPWSKIAKRAGVEEVLARDASGRPVRLVELTPEVRKAAGMVKASRSKPDPKQAELARKAKLEAAALRLACAELVNRIEERERGLAALPDAARRIVLRVVIGAFWSDLAKLVASRRGIELGKGGTRDALQVWAEGANVAQLEGAIAELVLVKCGGRDTYGAPIKAAELFKALGLDMAKFRREASKGDKPAKKKPATKKGKPKRKASS